MLSNADRELDNEAHERKKRQRRDNYAIKKIVKQAMVDLASEDQAVAARATEVLERASHTIAGKHAMGASLFHAMHQHVDEVKKNVLPQFP